MDKAKIERVAAEVIAELRAMGLASLKEAPVSRSTTAPGRASEPSHPYEGLGALIRPYGAESAPMVAPAAYTASATQGSTTLRPEEPGLSTEGRPTVTCNVSNRHIHLTQKDLETLFGPGAQLTPRNELMQPFQFAAKETVSLIAGRGRAIESVRILGPLRKYTQVEISRTDGFYLGIRPPVRQSGEIAGSAAGTLVGPKGTLLLKEGIIVADRHIHTPPGVAQRFGLANNQMIRVRVAHTEKPTLLELVRIRISDEFLFEMHIDNDDANATGVQSGDRVELVI